MAKTKRISVNAFEKTMKENIHIHKIIRLARH